MSYSPVGIRRFLHVLLAIFLAGAISFASVPLSSHAQAQTTATNITVTSATIPVNGTGTTDVLVNGISGPNGLGAYDLRIDFDRTKVNAVNVLGGTAPFSSEPTNNITAGATTAANNTGRLNFNAFHTSVPGPTGNIKVATISWRALAEGTHPLTLTIVTLADTKGDNVTGAAVVSGSITVPAGPPGQPPPPPQPTPAPTTPPPPPPATGAPTTPPAGATSPPPAPTTPPPPGATPQPATPPGAPAGTAVEIGTATVAPGASVQVPVTVKNFTATSGFGSYDFELTFNPERIRINAVRAGDQPFGDPAASNISNTSGKVFLNDFIAQVPGPKGNITVAILVVAGVAGGTSPISLKITTLSAADGADIPATIVNGNITVSGAPVPGTATPPPPPPPPTGAPTTPPLPPPTTPPPPKPTTPPPTAKPTTPPPPPVTSPPPPKPTVPIAPPTAKPTTPAPTPTPTPERPGPSLPLIIGIIVVVVAIIVVVVITRKKPTSPD